ncbi:MAG: LPS export ABC transporter periplasmic protein LptC [Candidatus Sulfobium sp.]|jgi:LPS export ABC transporter protein LptC
MERALLIIFLMVLFSLFFYFSRDRGRTAFGVRQAGDSYMEGVRIVNRKNGKRDWVLTADRADIAADGRVAYLKNIEIKIEGRGVTVYADKGSYDIDGKNLTLDGRTVAKGDSYSITSQNVEFNSAKDSLATDGKVYIKGKKFRVNGKGMAVDNAAHKVRILRDVKAVFYN